METLRTMCSSSWLVVILAWQVSCSVVLHEYHSPQLLGPLTSYSSLSVTTWTVPPNTRLATWTIQSSSDCSPAVNITM